MRAAVTFCRTLDGDEAAPTDLPRRADDEEACDEEVVCKCGSGPVVCCRGVHDGPHAAYGIRSLLTVWESVDPVEVVARAITTAIGEDFDDNDTVDQALAMDCGRDVVAALRENGFSL